MKNKMDVEEIAHHIYRRNNKIKNKNEITKNIKKYNLISINNINVYKRVIQLPNYKRYVHLFEKYDTNLNILNYDNDGNIINKQDTANYKVVNFEYVECKKTNILSYIFNIQEEKKAIFIILETYHFLLKSLYLLSRLNLYVNLTKENIYICENIFEPLIYDIENAILIDYLKNENYKKLFVNIQFDIEMPFELFIIKHIMNSGDVAETLELNEIEEITATYLNNINGLFQFYKDADFCDSAFSHQCKTFLLQYNNVSKKEIIRDLLQFIHTWDNYRISIIYLIIIKNITNKFKIGSPLINNLLSFLFGHIIIHPANRVEVKNTMVMFNKLIDTNIDWDFTKE
jgi:hypothetical protein